MKLQIDADDLRPIVELVVHEVFHLVEAEQTKLNGKLAYTESEAASLLGIQPHVLRDTRLRGEIEASRIGKRVVYSRDALLGLLARNRIS